MMTLTKYGIREWGVGLVAAVVLLAGCCWIGAFDARAVESLLDFSAPRRLLYLLAVGYPAEMPVGETVALDEDASYYLDDRDVLHVPKYRLDDLVSWR